MLIRVALAIADKPLRAYLARNLAASDIRVETLGKQPTIWQKVMRCACDVILLSESYLPGAPEEGISMLNNLPENPTTIVILDKDSAEAHAQLTAAGADVVLFGGISRKSMSEAIESALESRRYFIQRRRLDRRAATDPKLSDFDSDSQVMQLFMEDVLQVAPSDTPILLLGETGVGKEHLAKAIHAHSPRSIGPFISVNMAAMPEQLLESELFGHEQGAFTGAMRYRRGVFELAHGGTLFLDEIGEMPLYLQAKLLRVLQDYEIKPLGGEVAIELDVRVIAATNQDLEALIVKGDFRRDLYYRLSVMMLNIPPLRQRKEDIPSMVRRFMSLYRHRIGREVTAIEEGALQALCEYDWPGNVRELMNVIERAILLSKGDTIRTVDLPQVFRGEAFSLDSLVDGQGFDWDNLIRKPLSVVRGMVVDEVERRYLVRLLQDTGGRIDQTARKAGIHSRALYNKMRRLNLDKADFKPGR
jgi:two-component system, NtrC family, response regulator AtoC